jgi:hypothetical protein
MAREPDKPMLKSFVYGLGGRVTTQRVLEQAIQELADGLHLGRMVDGTTYLGLREGTAT